MAAWRSGQVGRHIAKCKLLVQEYKAAMAEALVDPAVEDPASSAHARICQLTGTAVSCHARYKSPTAVLQCIKGVHGWGQEEVGCMSGWRPTLSTQQLSSMLHSNQNMANKAYLKEQVQQKQGSWVCTGEPASVYQGMGHGVWQLQAVAWGLRNSLSGAQHKAQLQLNRSYPRLLRTLEAGLREPSRSHWNILLVGVLSER